MIKKINLFRDFYGNTLRLEDIFKHAIQPEKVIKSGSFEKHICKINVYLGTKVNGPLRALLEAIMPNTYIEFTGTAILHPEDTSNALVGKDVAEHKALAKVFNYEYKIFDYLSNLFADISINNPLYGYRSKAVSKRNRQLNCIQKMINK